MLITQLHFASGQSTVGWISGIGAVVGGSATDLVFQNADGTFSHVIGTGLSFDAFSNTWSGSVTSILRAMAATPDQPGTIGITTELSFATAVSVSALSAGLTGAFVGQLMNVPGNSNAGTGTSGNDSFAGSTQADSFDGGLGTDVVDYAFATLGLSVDLSGAVAATGAAAGDVLTGIEGIRGTAAGDTLRGNAGRNLLDGAAGDDLILAGAGVDTLAGGAGWDRLDMTGLAGDLTVAAAVVGSSGFSGFESFVTGAGNDLIYGQTGDAEYLTNAGHDIIKLGGSGGKTVASGAGNDLIEVYGGSSFALDMGADRDSLTFVGLAGPVAAQIVMTDVGTGTMSGAVSGSIAGVEVINSANLRLSYRGHAGRDEVHAGQANDSIWGANGDDLIWAGNGDDLLYGDSDWGFQGGSQDYGSDVIWAEGGNDTIHAAQGNDSYSGGAGVDVLSYAQLIDEWGNGTFSITLNADGTVTKAFRDNYGDIYTETDTILRSAGDDIEVIIGTMADDTFINAGAARTFEGGGGADLYLISAANGGDTLRGFANGADLIRVSAGATATAVLGANWTAAASSNTFGNLTFDTAGFDLNAAGLGGTSGVTIRNLLTDNGSVMTGTSRADWFETASGMDTIEGGEGDDTYVSLGGGIGLIYDSGTSLGDHLIVDASVWLGMSIEHVTLVGSALTANGNAAANRMIGNDLGNTFVGAGGADTLQGGLGSDTYTYSGSETLIEAAYQAPYYDFDLGWIIDPDRDRIISLVSYTMADSGFEDLDLTGTAANGTGNLQGNRITGTAAANTLRGLGGDDSLLGGGGSDSLQGGAANDRLRGDGGADTLRGEVGDDTLVGSDGADLLAGGAGINRLTGGRGADQFTFGKVAETTVVSDFTDGVDVLAFAGSSGATEAFILANAVQAGKHVILTTPVAGMEITVLNTTIAALAGDILIL